MEPHVRSETLSITWSVSVSGVCCTHVCEREDGGNECPCEHTFNGEGIKNI